MGWKFFDHMLHLRDHPAPAGFSDWCWQLAQERKFKPPYPVRTDQLHEFLMKFAAPVMRWLDTLPNDAILTSRQVCEALGGLERSRDPQFFNDFIRMLYACRKQNLMPGYWSKGGLNPWKQPNYDYHRKLEAL